jgi:hypothetical protein
VAALASIGNDRTVPHPAASSTEPASGSPSPAPPSASPSATPSSAPPSSEPPGPSAPTDLSNATIVVGAWSAIGQTCPTGPTTFTRGNHDSPDKSQLTVEKTAAVDLDQDGGTETVAIIDCHVGQAGTYQAVAVKAAPDGSLSTLGEIIHADPTMADIKGVAAGPGGTVALTVGDIVPCCATPLSLELTQVRTFAWNGSAFTQVDGPTTFTADASVADVVVSAPTLNFGAKVNGTRTGTLTLTVRNRGPQAAEQVTILLDLRDFFSIGPGQDWAKCPVPGADSPATRLCQLGTLPAGSTVTLTLPLTTQADASYMQPADAWTVNLYPRTGNLKYPSVPIPVTFS